MKYFEKTAITAAKFDQIVGRAVGKQRLSSLQDETQLITRLTDIKRSFGSRPDIRESADRWIDHVADRALKRQGKAL